MCNFHTISTTFIHCTGPFNAASGPALTKHKGIWKADKLAQNILMEKYVLDLFVVQSDWVSASKLLGWFHFVHTDENILPTKSIVYFPLDY